jgi:hypothetical protein
MESTLGTIVTVLLFFQGGKVTDVWTREGENGLLYQAHVGMVESYVFDSRNISS